MAIPSKPPAGGVTVISVDASQVGSCAALNWKDQTGTVQGTTLGNTARNIPCTNGVCNFQATERPRGTMVTVVFLSRECRHNSRLRVVSNHPDTLSCSQSVLRTMLLEPTGRGFSTFHNSNDAVDLA